MMRTKRGTARGLVPTIAVTLFLAAGAGVWRRRNDGAFSGRA